MNKQEILVGAEKTKGATHYDRVYLKKEQTKQHGCIGIIRMGGKC
jgi:hypothetical protein